MNAWPRQEPRCDFDSIHRKVVAFERDDGAWVEWFDRHAISPLRIRYEAFANRPAGTIDICQALVTEPPEPGHVKSSLAKLSDAVSLEWIGRYKADSIKAGRSAD